MARIFVDTNVLFPFSVMDLMLALTEDAVHEVIWTEMLLAEWERVIVRQHHRSAGSAASITAAIREFFPESRIAEEDYAPDYAPLVASMPGADPDDRRHMAAAISGRARILVTWNLLDFPAEPLAALGLRVVDPNQYLCELLDQFPQEVTATVPLRSYGSPGRNVALPRRRPTSPTISPKPE
jgi:predicted nucleic acid-binding protein